MHARRRAAQRRGPLVTARIDQAVTAGHVHPRRRDPRRRQQRLGGRRRHRVRGDRRPARRRRRSSRSSATARSRRSCAPTPTTTTSGSRPALRERVTAPILLHPDDRPLWELTHTDELWDVDLADGQEIEVAGTTLRVLHTPGPRARWRLLPRRGARLRVHRGHAVRRRSRRDRPVVQRPRRCWSTRSRPGCSRCPTTPWCTPGTATTPRSAPSARTSAPETRQCRSHGVVSAGSGSAG